MKKLENEYKQLMQSETPDLWSRIEAGIDASLAASGKVASEQAASKNSENSEVVYTDEITESAESSKQNKVFVINWRKYSLPIVACIAAILCVPLLLTGFLRMAGTTKGSVEMAADCAMEETTAVTMDCAAEESVEESVAEYVTEDSMDDAAVIEETAETEVYVTQATESNVDAKATEDLVDEYANTESADVGNADAYGEDTGGTDANKQATVETVQMSHILTVTEIAIFDEKSAGTHEGGTVYYIVTEEKGECTLFVPDDLDFRIDMNGQFTIKAEITDSWYDYVLVEIL